MPSKKKKYNARFPAGRIKKIMQSDEEVGKVAQAVPVIISRTLELFVGSLLQKAMQITSAKNAKTLTPSHMKQCILSEQRFDFLKDLVNSVQDSANGEDDLVGASSSILVASRSYPQRRRSSNYIVEETITKEEPILKEESTIKEEPNAECSETSTVRMIPKFYSEPVPEQMKLNNVIKREPVTEPQANCSTHHFSPNFYSESVPDQRIMFGPTMKKEPSQCTINRPGLSLNSNYYTESVSPHLLKTEKITTDTPPDSSTIQFSPNYYSESVPDQRNVHLIKDHPQVMANCSTIRFGPNFYSETHPEQKVSIHRPPVSHQEPTRIAHLSMDEDYDT